MDLAHRRRRQALFLSLFLPAVLLAVLTAPAALARLPTWTRDGPLLLFFGLLTAINAPFDWLSLGLTRGLLRRGIEMGGLWPLVLAAIDVVASVILIVLLTVAMVVGVQAFDLASGRAPLLPLGDLFDGIAAMPLAAKHWWVYALLLSTQFPSLLNLTIAATALFRGLPPLARWVRARMPAGEAVPGFDRQFVAFALTGQVVLGFVFGVVVEAAVVYGMLFVVLPLFGFELLEFARALAALDLPRLAMGG